MTANQAANPESKNFHAPMKINYVIRLCLMIAIMLCATRYVSVAGDVPRVSPELSPLIKTLSSTLQNAVEAKDFSVLEKSAPKNKSYLWGGCGPGDVETDKLSSRDMVQMLLKDSNGVSIYYDPEPDILDFGDKSKDIYVTLFTEGWASEFPFLGFGFTVNKHTKQWSWDGVCYDAVPPVRISKSSGKYSTTWFREPTLPRPGPRRFKDVHNLHARINEIIELQAFDALKPYAISQKLKIAECNREMIENNKLNGKDILIDEAIDLLKNSSRNSKKIKFTGGTYERRETVGWSGDYPYIAFWFLSGKAGWELNGLSYCKSPHFSLILEGDEKNKFMKYLEKGRQ